MRKIDYRRLIGLIILIVMAILAGFYIARFQLSPIWIDILHENILKYHNVLYPLRGSFQLT